MIISISSLLLPLLSSVLLSSLPQRLLLTSITLICLLLTLSSVLVVLSNSLLTKCLLVMTMRESMPNYTEKMEGKSITYHSISISIHLTFNLYSYVRTIRSWFNDEVDGDDYAFSWPVDQNLSSGRYYVEICTDDRDDISRSFIFELDSNRGTANKGSNGNSRGNRGNSRGAKGNRH